MTATPTPPTVRFSELGFQPGEKLRERFAHYAAGKLPWQVDKTVFREALDQLYLSDGRWEIDRLSRATSPGPEDDLKAALDQYFETFIDELDMARRVARHTGEALPGQAVLRDLIDRRDRLDPDEKVAIYRAVSARAEATVKPGDWVALERDYAELHGSGGYDEEGGSVIVIEQVKLRDLAWAGSSVDEWFYAPEDFRLPELGLHEVIVRCALANGWEVPDVVLVDYPALAAELRQASRSELDEDAFGKKLAARGVSVPTEPGPADPEQSWPQPEL